MPQSCIEVKFAALAVSYGSHEFCSTRWGKKMSQSDNVCNRKEPRFRVCRDEVFECETTIAEETAGSASLVDVSSNGLRLLCEGQFEVGMAFSTELRTKRSQATYHGVIRNVEPWADTQSMVGCELSEPIPPEVLQELIAEGIVNRRCDDRITWDKPAALSGDQNTEELDVEIRDYSPGGIRLFSQEPIPDNVALKVRVQCSLGDEVVVAATTIWKSQKDDGCHAGLAFTTCDGPHKISEIHQYEEFGIEPEGYSPPRLIRPSIVAGAAGVLFTVTAFQFVAIGIPALREIF